MIRSMTGYGAAEALTESGWKISVECRSVNHRGLEARIHTAREWAWLEPIGQAIAKKYLKRGRVDMRIECAQDKAHVPGIVDEAKFANVAKQLGHLAKENGLTGGVTLADVLGFREVLATNTPNIDVDREPVFARTVEKAIINLAASRSEEGAKLVDTMESLLAEVQENLTAIEANIGGSIDAYRDRLAIRVVDAAQKFGIGEIDRSRLVHEVVIYADRVAIAEEIQRATSHLSQLAGVLHDDSGEARGKKVDFYLQELMREANTMGSKTGSSDVTNRVVDMKAAIEKMREQAANIE